VPNLPVYVNYWGRSACYPRGTFYPLSYGPSIQNRRITKPCFRTCSTCRSHSQAPLRLYTLRMISKHAEGTFGRLRYLLGGNRPSQTAHLTLSRARIHGTRLGPQLNQGGIPGSGCSKGPRGLSVLSRVTCIFTGTTISPSPSLRQRSSRYAIRAGRNLPDKEFRYLRTVIVTAAINRGFNSELRSFRKTT
jgi:hypothetical protein